MSQLGNETNCDNCFVSRPYELMKLIPVYIPCHLPTTELSMRANSNKFTLSSSRMGVSNFESFQQYIV